MTRRMDRVSAEMTRLNTGIGAWLVLSPRMLGFADVHSPAAWITWLLGVAALAIGIAGMRLPRPMEDSATLAVGALLTLSSAALSFAMQTTPTINTLVAGLLAVVVGVYAIRRDGTSIKWLRNRRDGAF